MTRPCQKRQRKKLSLLKKFRFWSKKSLPTEKQWDKYETVSDRILHNPALDRAMSKAVIIYNNSLTKLEQHQNDEVEFVRVVTAVMQMRKIMTSLDIEINEAPSPPFKRFEELLSVIEIMEV